MHAKSCNWNFADDNQVETILFDGKLQARYHTIACSINKRRYP